MEGALEIRILGESDAAAWWMLRLEALTNEPLAFGKSVEEHLETTAEIVALRIRELPEDSAYFGAFVGEELAGIASFVRETGLKERHKAHVYGVYVTPAHRGKGVARRLLSAIVEFAKADGSVEQIQLAAAITQNAAKRLYLSLGFVSYGTEPRALKVGEAYVDEDLMVLLLR